MGERTWWETTKVQGGELLDRVKQLVHEGNVRRIVISQGDRTVAEFPLTAGLVGAVFAPTLAAVGALAALLTDCSIAVERERTTTRATEAPEPESQTPETASDSAVEDAAAPESATLDAATQQTAPLEAVPPESVAQEPGGAGGAG